MQSMNSLPFALPMIPDQPPLDLLEPNEEESNEQRKNENLFFKGD